MEKFKDIVLNVDVSTSQRDCIPTRQEFRSYDQKSARIIINITKNKLKIPADSIKAVRFFMSSSDQYGRIIDGMLYKKDIEQVVDGQAILVLPDEYLCYSGRAVIHIYIVFVDGPTNDAGQAFLIDFKRSAIDSSSVGNIVPTYIQNFDDILNDVQSAANEKMEEINSLGVDLGEFVKDYLAESPDIATKEYVDIKTDVSDRLLLAWLFLEAEGET